VRIARFFMSATGPHPAPIPRTFAPSLDTGGGGSRCRPQPEANEHANHGLVLPGAAARCRNAKLVELLGNGPQRQADQGRERIAQRLVPRSRSRGHGLGLRRVAELHPARLRSREPGARALADHAALLLGQGRVDVQRERINISAERTHNERHLLRHERRDERDVAAQPVELGNADGRLGTLGRLQRCRKLRPASERVGTLAGLDLGVFRGDLEAFRLRERGDGGALRFEAEAGAPLLGGRDTVCRASQRRFRNTLIFVAADEASLGTAREVMRKAIAWDEIAKDKRLGSQLTTAQLADAEEKAKSNKESALKAVRTAWSHILYPVKSETAGKPFDLEHDPITARERAAVPVVVYDKAKADGIALEKLGTERLWLALKPIWPDDRSHLAISEVAEWFASYVYLPKLRDSVVFQAAIWDTVAKLDPTFAYADGFDEATGRYRNLIWAKTPPDIMPPTAVLVRAAEALDQLKRDATVAGVPAGQGGGTPTTGDPATPPDGGSGGGTEPSKPRRFYGSVEIDMVRPVKSFDAILNAVVMELQRTQGAKVKLTLEIAAEAPSGFADGEVGIVRDNARQLKFKAESTGFED
jgi:hypothetical protein